MEILPFEELLTPVPGGLPSGENLRFAPEWDELEAARGSDREAWETGGKREANWNRIQALASELLQSRSKDLRLAVFLSEACVHLHGFGGAAESVNFVRQLLTRFWDVGLHPEPENGSYEDRAVVLGWFNEKFADLLAVLPFTARDSGPNYGLADLRHARVVGWERDTLDSSGFPIEARRRRFDDAISSGQISLDIYTGALKATGLKPLEIVHSSIQAAVKAFAEFGEVLDERFGKLSPSLGASRTVFEEVLIEVEGLLKQRRAEQPDSSPGGPSDMTSRPGGKDGSRSLPGFSDNAGVGGDWHEAETMIRSGKVDDGLRLMTQLAGKETAGRNRFHRKLILADVCISLRRDRLARTILEELNEQITKHKLDEWETPEVSGSVWSRLYSIYHKKEPESERTVDLYRRLSRLDPWQVLAINEDSG